MHVLPQPVLHSDRRSKSVDFFSRHRLDLILITDREGTFTRVSPSSMTILGYLPKEMVGHSGAEFIHPADLVPTRNEMRLARRGHEMRNFESRYVHRDGRIVILAWSGVWSETEQKHFFIGRDRTELKKHEDALRAQNMRFDAALNNMSQGLCMFDREQRLVVTNERYLDMYGLSPAQVIPGIAFRDLLLHRVEQGSFPAASKLDEYLTELLESLHRGLTWTKVTELPDGRFVAVSNRPMPGGGWVSTHEDITEQCRTKARVAHLEHYDSLTDLPNRVLLRERLKEALSDCNDGAAVAVLFLDLDRFKEVNDALGHYVGDELLKEVARRLCDCVQAKDTVARLGGDEFAILQLGSDQPISAATLATRVINAISDLYELTNHQVIIGTSIGISVSPNDATDADQLLANADLALYRAKNEGRGTFRFFETGMDERMQARRSLEVDLRKALRDGNFEIHYQPIINLERNEVVTFEALLRWNHPAHGRISPAQFIPLAEDTGLIVPIGEWTMRAACARSSDMGWGTQSSRQSLAVAIQPEQPCSNDLQRTYIGRVGSVPARN